MNDFLNYLNTLTSKELKMTVSAVTKTKATGRSVINEYGQYVFDVKAKLTIQFHEHGTPKTENYDFDFTYTNAEIKLLDIMDHDGEYLDYSTDEQEQIQNFFAGKLLFTFKKEF